MLFLLCSWFLPEGRTSTLTTPLVTISRSRICRQKKGLGYSKLLVQSMSMPSNLYSRNIQADHLLTLSLKAWQTVSWPLWETLSDKEVINNYLSCVRISEAGTIISKVRDRDIFFERYSPRFCSLLPGMKVAPICLEINKNSWKTRMHMDTSSVEHRTNDLIDKYKV